ncbi:hypothetical protein AB0K47_28610 [Streptomyces tirandamycinicus]|uniref:hypothetical protein n=1 Tax=Streptomyces tirandamycinicus TaxID=2174846 RepID=UPI003448B85C
MAGIDLGDAPTWLGAIFAAGAAGAAIWTLKSQRDQIAEQRDFIAEQSANLRLEREALLAAAKDRRERQARGVRLEVERQYVYVFNESDAPIMSVSCIDGDAPPVRSCVVDATGNVATELIAAMVRGEDSGPDIDLVGVGQAAVFQRAEGGRRAVSVSFSDVAGIDWWRDEDGALLDADGRH